MVEFSSREQLTPSKQDLASQLTKPDSSNNSASSNSESEMDAVLKLCQSEKDTMSRHEMVQIIEKQRQEIRYLKEKLRLTENEKETIIENFQVSTSVLLDRLKDFEGQQVATVGSGERPQTATVLSRLNAEKEGRRIGSVPGGFGTGGLGSGIDGGKVGQHSADLANHYSETTQVDEPEDKKVQEEDIECPNCGKLFTQKQVIVHTIQCYRNSTKCKICSEVIHKTKKKEHLETWRDKERLVQAIKQDDERKVGLFFEHGLDINAKFGDSTQSPMHVAAFEGSLNTILDLISRGANIDPLDKNSRTPLSLAIEHNKYSCVRSLIELGADIEQRDSFGRTPLMFACKLGSKEMVELLLHYKADVKATNNMKESCVSFAQKSGNQELVVLLVKHGGSLRPQSGIGIRPQSGVGRSRPPSGIKK